MKNDRENRSDEKGEGNNLEFDEKRNLDLCKLQLLN